MKLADSFRLSLNSILHRRLRAWLTLLGIIIGVAAVVSIISIAEGANASVQQNLNSFGADVLTINAGFSRVGGFGGNFRGGAGMRVVIGENFAASAKEPTLGNLDIIVVRGNPNVMYVNQTVSGRGELVFLSEKINANIQGVNPATVLQTDNLQLESGRMVGPSDSGTVVIGSRIANDTFKQPITLGRRVSIEGKPFTVVGILREGSDDGSVYMNYTSAWDVTDVNINTYSAIKAKLRDVSLVDDTLARLTSSLQISRKVTERTQDFSIFSPAAIREQISSALDSLALFLAAIAAVSLIVGAVGIANSMFTSVLEKTREIGIMKALGSTNNEILQLFVIESALFGLLGGIAGVLLGIIISLALSQFASLNTLVTPQLMLVAIGISTVIGVLSGIMPARAASKLKPVEALRYE